MSHKVDLDEQLLGYFKQQYHDNQFVNLLGMKIVAAHQGRLELSMLIDAKHTNLYKVVHGGALASLADTAMGVACATLGSRVVTLEFNMNFIHNVKPGDEVRALATVIHHGRTTMVVEASLTDQAGQLLCKARGTFFVIGKFEAMPTDDAEQA